ncbi:lysozyme inhibitor LprI family protein [Methylobacterium brachiatum]|uniref:lysozyme inhibitor LprI family protein n=1 Tax=Methylobacterium brachiatum TaxID=269660 RepID=UPI000EFC2D46|nr:lysozyme inhibitor LprI family protein [Methylobacterium brachiatum]AYO84446.1 DUF1311 domain-containing protein [Methylobacterium brachiatum]CAA2156821.1 hypothetical protein MBRA_02257 [Methylobacterium brachiatum]
MSKRVLGALLGACAGVIATVSVAPPAVAAPPAPASGTCDTDEPTACMNRYGEGAARSLSRAYGKAAGQVDALCAEAVSSGICLEPAQQVADKDLNATYARALASIGDDAEGRTWRARLKQAQQAWLRFRDADCGDLTFSEWGSGTGAGPAMSACLIAHTVERTAELRRRYGRR